MSCGLLLRQKAPVMIAEQHNLFLSLSCDITCVTLRVWPRGSAEGLLHVESNLIIVVINIIINNNNIVIVLIIIIVMWQPGCSCAQPDGEHKEDC